MIYVFNVHTWFFALLACDISKPPKWNYDYGNVFWKEFDSIAISNFEKLFSMSYEFDHFEMFLS